MAKMDWRRARSHKGCEQHDEPHTDRLGRQADRFLKGGTETGCARPQAKRQAEKGGRPSWRQLRKTLRAYGVPDEKTKTDRALLFHACRTFGLKVKWPAKGGNYTAALTDAARQISRMRIEKRMQRAARVQAPTDEPTAAPHATCLEERS